MSHVNRTPREIKEDTKELLNSLKREIILRALIAVKQGEYNF